MIFTESRIARGYVEIHSDLTCSFYFYYLLISAACHIALAFLQNDQSQLEYYMQITKTMPGKVLSRHSIVHYESDNFIINTENLTA